MAVRRKNNSQTNEDCQTIVEMTSAASFRFLHPDERNRDEADDGWMHGQCETQHHIQKQQPGTIIFLPTFTNYSHTRERR